MNRKMTWALLASLLINAALVGYIVGNHGRGGPFGFFKSARPMPPRVMTQNPADDTTREILRNAFDAERETLRGALKDAAAARRASEAILRADPLDAAQLEATMTQLRASNAAAQESFHRALRDAATKLDVNQRQALGRLLERAPTTRMGLGGDGFGENGMGGWGGPRPGSRPGERPGEHPGERPANRLMPPPPPPGE